MTVKNGDLKSRVLTEEKTNTSTNNQLLSFRKSEQKKSVLKALALAVLNSWLLIKTNTSKTNTFYCNTCDLGYKKDRSYYDRNIACIIKLNLSKLDQKTKFDLPLGSKN